MSPAWAETEDYYEGVPFFAEAGLFADKMDFKLDGEDQRLEAREQLWATREELE